MDKLLPKETLATVEVVVPEVTVPCISKVSPTLRLNTIKEVTVPNPDPIVTAELSFDQSVMFGTGFGNKETSDALDAQVPAVVSLTSNLPINRMGTLVLAVVEYNTVP